MTTVKPAQTARSPELPDRSPGWSRESTELRTPADVANDWGHIISSRPAAVVRPSSPEDVATALSWTRDAGLQAVARGTAHSTFGQSQLNGGVVIDMTGLDRVHSIERHQAVVDAGVRWSQLARAAYEYGLTPPVMPEYLDLTVGGTLSLGGVGGTSHRYGAQIDHAPELLVVTGGGELTRCSPAQNPDLYTATLATLGRVGIITGATVRLIPAPDRVVLSELRYDELEPFLADLRRLAEENRTDYLEARIKLTTPDLTQCVIESGSFTGPRTTTRDVSSTRRLLCNAEPRITELPYPEFLTRINANVAEAKRTGEWERPHSCFFVFLPRDQTGNYLRKILPILARDGVAQGWALLCPVRGANPRRSLLWPLSRSVSYLLGIDLTIANAKDVSSTLGRNRELFALSTSIGGVAYPFGSIPLTERDWQAAFRNHWKSFDTARHRYNPDATLRASLEIPPPTTPTPPVTTGA